MIRRDFYWIGAFAIGYMTSMAIAIFHFDFSLYDILPVVVVFGLGFPAACYLVFRSTDSTYAHKPTFKEEGIVVMLLVAWIIFYITYGSSLIDALLPARWLKNEQAYFLIIMLKKLLVFVAIPFFVYRVFGFTLIHFGFRSQLREVFSLRNIIGFIFLSICIVLFQYFFSGSGATLHPGHFKWQQLLFAVPLTLIWLFIEAGLVEEFFFRALLQSRASVLLRSESAGILLAVLVFALAHVPGLYLRGSGSEGITDPMSLGFWIVYCMIYMSTAGLFLGVTWSKTRNIYLIMALHAVTDLLPNLGDLIRIWHI